MATGKKEKFRTINTPDFISSEEDDVDALGRTTSIPEERSNTTTNDTPMGVRGPDTLTQLIG